MNKANNFQLPSEFYSNDYNNLKSFNYNWDDFIKSYVNTDKFNISSCIEMFANNRSRFSNEWATYSTTIKFY